MRVFGAVPEWLALQDLARAWSEETGGSAQALAGDFTEWLEDYLLRNGYVQAAGGGAEDGPDVLEELLEHPVWRDTFERYCEERGLAKPRFWFPDRPGSRFLARRSPVAAEVAVEDGRRSEAPAAVGAQPRRGKRTRAGSYAIVGGVLALVVILALGSVGLRWSDPNDRVSAGETDPLAGGQQVIALMRSVEPDSAAAPAETGPPRGLVRLIQQELKAVGFDPGPVDGQQGPRLAAAIEAYQRARGLPVDGRVSVGLLSRLGQDVPRHAHPSPAVSRATAAGD